MPFAYSRGDSTCKLNSAHVSMSHFIRQGNGVTAKPMSHHKPYLYTDS